MSNDFKKIPSNKQRVLRYVFATLAALMVVLGYVGYRWFSVERAQEKWQPLSVTNTVTLVNTNTVVITNTETNRVSVTNVRTNYKRVYVIEPARDIQEVISNESSK